MIILKKVLKFLLMIVLLLITLFVAIIIYAVISDYKPASTLTEYTSDNPDILSDSATISLMTWNIGYCGLDKDMDFFYDGGTKVVTPHKNFETNLEAVKSFIKGNDTIDFLLIQEIDRNSKRSYHCNEFDTLGKSLQTYYPLFAKNYDVFFVPVPPTNPMGKVLSGIASFSKYRPESSIRYSFPGKYGFPKQLFMLDRCFLVNRYPLSNGKELLVINTHNEAFDPGQIRKAQMAFLKEFLLSEYSKGNYIITGGDWNQSPPDFKPAFSANKINKDQMMMETDYLPEEWKWVYDNTIPSNRTVIAAYDPATTTTTVIDQFLLSPNIRDISIQCIDLGFVNSDHNPVRIKVKLGN
jgi:endonuclease/exonuclease/phosphatase family metal-dependent hydrolase